MTIEITEYAKEKGWDPATVCSLTDKSAQKLITATMANAIVLTSLGKHDEAQSEVRAAVRLTKVEVDAGRTRQAERARREAEA